MGLFSIDESTLASTKYVLFYFAWENKIYFLLLGKQLNMYFYLRKQGKDFLLLQKTTKDLYFAWKNNHR